MDYKKHYDQLIKRGQERLLEGYSERHHIIPRCMGGSDDTSNLVRLTAEEHYVAHQLLVKIYPGNHKLIYAANLMSAGSIGQQRYNNKSYGWLRKRLSETKQGTKQTAEANAKRSITMKGRPAHNKGTTHTAETKRKMSLASKGKPKSKEHAARLRKILVNTSGMTGRTHSAETKRKMSESAKKRAAKKREAEECLEL